MAASLLGEALAPEGASARRDGPGSRLDGSARSAPAVLTAAPSPGDAARESRGTDRDPRDDGRYGRRNRERDDRRRMLERDAYRGVGYTPREEGGHVPRHRRSRPPRGILVTSRRVGRSAQQYGVDRTISLLRERGARAASGTADGNDDSNGNSAGGGDDNGRPSEEDREARNKTADLLEILLNLDGLDGLRREHDFDEEWRLGPGRRPSRGGTSVGTATTAAMSSGGTTEGDDDGSEVRVVQVPVLFPAEEAAEGEEADGVEPRRPTAYEEPLRASASGSSSGNSGGSGSGGSRFGYRPRRANAGGRLDGSERSGESMGMMSTGTFADTARRGVAMLNGSGNVGVGEGGLDDSLRTETSELTMDVSSHNYHLGPVSSPGSDEAGGEMDRSGRSGITGGSSLGGISLGMTSTGTFGDTMRRGVGRHPPTTVGAAAPSPRGSGRAAHQRLVASAVAPSRRGSWTTDDVPQSRRATPCTSNLASSRDAFLGAYPGIGGSPDGSPPTEIGNGGPAPPDPTDGVAPPISVGSFGGAGIGHYQDLGSSLDSKATLGMMSTGTFADAAGRGVARLRTGEPPESLSHDGGIAPCDVEMNGVTLETNSVALPGSIGSGHFGSLGMASTGTFADAAGRGVARLRTGEPPETLDGGVVIPAAGPASSPSGLSALLDFDGGGHGIGSLSGSLGSKSTLGMMSTGTGADAAMRGVSRRGRGPAGPGSLTDGRAPDRDDDARDGDFPFSLHSTGSLVECTRRHVPPHGTSNQDWPSGARNGEDGMGLHRVELASERVPAARHERNLSEQTPVVSNRSEAATRLREAAATNPILTSLDPLTDPLQGEYGNSLVRQMEILSRLHSGSPGADEFVESSGRSLLRRRDRFGRTAEEGDADAPRQGSDQDSPDGSDRSGGPDLLQRYFRNKDKNRTPPASLDGGLPARPMDGAAFHAERRSLLERASVGDRVKTITVDRRGPSSSSGAAAPADGGDGALRVSELTADFAVGLDAPDDPDGDRAHGVIAVPADRDGPDGAGADRRVSDLTTTGFDDDLEAELLESLGSHGVSGKDAGSTILGGSLIRNMSKVTLHEHDDESGESECEICRKERE